MTAPAAKSELIAALRRDRDQLLSAVAALEPESLEAGRYESGWNGRQILAHLAAIEWTYPRLIDLAAAASERTNPPAPAERPPREGMDGYNARQVEKRANATVAELLQEFARNREAFIAAVEAADEALLAAPVRSAGGRSGSLGKVLWEVSVEHGRGHLADLLGPGVDVGT